MSAKSSESESKSKSGASAGGGGGGTFYVLDAFALIYQVFHAIPLMTAPDGRPVNAVFGIFRDLLNILKQKRPDYLAAAFDGAGPVFRSGIDANYKAQRAEMPEDLVPQIDVIKRVYEGFRVPVIVSEGHEADDVIATLARSGAARGLEVFVCTSDKDARQLLGDRVRIYNLRKGQVLDEAGLMAEWGVRPDQVVDLLSLTGDAVDNVPGVPGIGLKTGAKLLAEHGTLDALLADPSKVGGKKAEALAAHAETALRARELVRLRDDLELGIDWEALRTETPDVAALKELCRECGFHKFQQELEAEWGRGDGSNWVADYRLVESLEDLRALGERLRGRSKFAIDTETTGLDPARSSLVGIAVSDEAGRGDYIPLRGPLTDPKLPIEAAREALGPAFADPGIVKIGQNLKFDLRVLERADVGFPVSGPLRDTMVMSYLLESGERNHGLDELSERFLNHRMIPITDLIGKGRDQRSIDEAPTDRVAEYAGEDADAAFRLEGILSGKLESEGLGGLYADLEEPLIRVLAKMETTGIAVDVARLRELSRQFGERLSALTSRIHELAGMEFNVNSTPQLREVLFDRLKLPTRGKTPKGEASTAAEVLEELAALHELPRALMEHRRLEKLKNTYLDALPELVHKDGRIRATFNQGVAATGRLSSSDPNLQNIPVRTEEGRQIRQAFVPGEPGWLLLSLDYSQIELRVLAHFSEDPALTKAFEEDRDIHAEVAARIFGVGPEEVTSERRRVAKTVNFGVIYGLSAHGLSGRLGIPQKEAETFIANYFREYAGVEAFMTRTLEEAKARGYVETLKGRRRAINGIKNTTGRARNLAERTAINTVIQGTAADLIKAAMIRVDRALSDSGLRGRLLLQIHDELLFESPAEEIPALAALARREMTEALPLRVPVRVDAAAGPNWLDVEELPDPTPGRSADGGFGDGRGESSRKAGPAAEPEDEAEEKWSLKSG